MRNTLFILIALFLPATLLAQDITYVEYFIDTDPGYGDANSIPVPVPGEDLALVFSADLSLLDMGMHQLFSRARDASGAWGPTVSCTFFTLKTPSSAESNIQEAEYYINTDPGFGMANSIPVPHSGQDLLLDFTADLQDLDQGIHQICIRARYANGSWGPGIRHTFYVLTLPPQGGSKIREMEYFIDSDPGFGKANPISLSGTSNDMDIDFNVSLTGKSNGTHIIYVRARNNLSQWGPVFAEIFSLSSGEEGKEIHSHFKLYPNPVSDWLMIEFPDETEFPVRLKITEMNGRVVSETECHKQSCEIKIGPGKGIYLISIEKENKTITQKIILE